MEDYDAVFILKRIEATVLTADEVAHWTRYDPVLAQVHEFILRGWPHDAGDDV